MSKKKKEFKKTKLIRVNAEWWAWFKYGVWLRDREKARQLDVNTEEVELYDVIKQERKN